MSHPHQNNGGYPTGGYHVSGPEDNYDPRGAFPAYGNGPDHFSHSGDLGDEDMRNMEEIEKELMRNMTDDDLDAMEDEFVNEASNETPAVPAGAVPTLGNGKLSTHAAEFWFPESRGCECCRGFKHGCPCTKAGFIACQIPGCVLEEHRAKMKPVEASRPAPSPKYGGYGDSSSQQECRFGSACRFGATCRYKHSNPGFSPANNGMGMGSRGGPQGPGPNGRQVCPHFLKGYCMFGDNCRNAHY